MVVSLLLSNFIAHLLFNLSIIWSDLALVEQLMLLLVAFIVSNREDENRIRNSISDTC